MKNNTTKKTERKVVKKCPACDGDGNVRYSVDGVIGTHTCQRCKGNGIITVVYNIPHQPDQTSDWRENRLLDMKVRYNNYVKTRIDIKDKLSSEFINEEVWNFIRVEVKNLFESLDQQEQRHQREMEKMRKKYLHNTIAWQKASFVIGGDDLLDQTIEIKNKFVSKELKLNECIKYLLPDEDQISQSINSKEK